MIQYSTSVLSTYVKPSDNQLSNVVIRVTWVYQAKEDFYVADLFKDTMLPSPNHEKFVNFNDLTQDVIMDWVSSIEDMKALKEQVTQMLLNSKNPNIVEKPVPWINKSPYTGEECYVIVNAGSIVYGPEKWNSIVFNNALVPYGFSKPLPADAIAYRQKIVPTDTPLDLGNQTKIYRIHINDEPEYDSTFYKLGKLKWSFDTGVAVATFQIVELSVPEVQARLANTLAHKEKQLSQLPKKVSIADIDYFYFPNQEQANLIVSKIISMSETDVTNWYQNSDIMDVNCEILKIILTDVNKEIDLIKTYKLNKTKEINNCKTIEELKKVEI